MRYEELTEGKNTPCIVVDVQPEYTGLNDGNELPWIDEMMAFLNKQTGPILMFVNAEDQMMSGDTIDDVNVYWEDSGFDPSNWDRVQVVDKGYGYFRAWMDSGVPESGIIKTIRAMYQQKITDSRELFNGEDDENYIENMNQLLGNDDWVSLYDDGLSVEWTSVGQLKRFSGAYIMGGGRDECLREVELLMNAFNIKYKRIEDFVY